MGAALTAIVNPAFLKTQKWQDQQWCANREGVHPDILEFEKRMIRRMSKLGVPMFASEVMRTPERQNDLYALGNSRAKGGQSPHQYGCAIDLVHSVKWWTLSQMEWRIVGHVGQEIVTQAGLAIVSLAWGGSWDFYDPAHWQINDWKMVKDQYPWPTK